ncbi:hypothetical protein RHSIM_RhsimUnG0124100 [Rhododendron simsii]|uniref:Rhodopsin n=1 Tax=Rhododendron simsii TaxID=118357 RepID=A0A834FVD3_RHOSS|nr:hypothetical protein RHSIM_RhsimUnG0124100 [Rhododendron simsii]
MSYYNQQQPPVGVPPPQGYPPEGYAKDAYPPPGYPPQGYPQPGYPPQGYPPQGGYPPQYAPQYAQPPPQQQQSSSTGMMEGWYAPPPPSLSLSLSLSLCFMSRAESARGQPDRGFGSLRGGSATGIGSLSEAMVETGKRCASRSPAELLSAFWAGLRNCPSNKVWLLCAVAAYLRHASSLPSMV